MATAALGVAVELVVSTVLGGGRSGLPLQPNMNEMHEKPAATIATVADVLLRLMVIVF